MNNAVGDFEILTVDRREDELSSETRNVMIQQLVEELEFCKLLALLSLLLTDLIDLCRLMMMRVHDLLIMMIVDALMKNKFD